MSESKKPKEPLTDEQARQLVQGWLHDRVTDLRERIDLLTTHPFAYSEPALHPYVVEYCERLEAAADLLDERFPKTASATTKV